jgi:hypothetical protein
MIITPKTDAKYECDNAANTNIHAPIGNQFGTRARPVV